MTAAAKEKPALFMQHGQKSFLIERATVQAALNINGNGVAYDVYANQDVPDNIVSIFSSGAESTSSMSLTTANTPRALLLK